MWRSVYDSVTHTCICKRHVFWRQDANPRHKILFIWLFPTLIRWSTDLEIYDFMHYYASTKSESIECFIEDQAFLRLYDSDPRPPPSPPLPSTTCLSFLFFLGHQGVTKRCRLSWLTNSSLVYEGCGVSANEYSCAHAHGAQINFGDLSPYLTYVGHLYFPQFCRLQYLPTWPIVLNRGRVRQLWWIKVMWLGAEKIRE